MEYIAETGTHVLELAPETLEGGKEKGGKKAEGEGV